MRILREWLHRLIGTLRPGRRDSDLEEELRLHLELAAEEARRRGLSPANARREAVLQAGGIGQAVEALRDRRGLLWLTDLTHDLRYACRTLARNRSLTLAAVLSLALGIGANTAIFSLVDAVVLRPLPVHAPGELVEPLIQYPGDPRLNGFTWNHYEAFRSRGDVFSGVIGMVPARVNVRGDGLNVDAVSGALVVGDFFPVLGLQTSVGRLIGPDDDQRGADAAAIVVSWDFWNSRFNRDPAIVGTRVTVNGSPATIVGVAPRAFVGLRTGFRTDIWMPVSMAPTDRPNLGVIARLAPGVSIDRAQAALEPTVREWHEAMAASNDPQWRRATFHVASARAGLSALRDRYATPLFVLMATVGVLLAIACTNIASLLLARGAARRGELALRVSLGASRFRIVRQVLTESLLLAALGAVLGLAAAPLAANALVQILTSGPGPMPAGFELHVQLDLRVLLFTAGTAIATGLFFGLAPAWQIRSIAPAAWLHGRGAVGESRSARLAGKSLIVVQVALSLVLLSGAGLFLRHLSYLRTNDLGFDPRSVLLVTLDPAGSGYDRPHLMSLYRDLLSRFESLPGVRSAALSATTPIARGSAVQFVNVDGFTEPADARRRVHLNWVSPRYFETLGTPLVAGRDFHLDDEGGPGVAIINQSTARYYFGDESPIGRRISSIDGQSGSYDIVGVVSDAKYETLHEPAPRTIYLNTLQHGGVFPHFSLSTSGAPGTIAADARRVIREHLPAIRVANVTTLVSQMDASLVPERVMATLSGLFAALGAMLAAIGLYGLLAYSVARRTNEIGVRMALGATGRNIAMMIARNAAGLTTAGLVIGFPIALWGRHLAASVIERLPVDDVVPVIVAALVILGVGLAAAWLPVRRATRVDPIDALRRE